MIIFCHWVSPPHRGLNMLTSYHDYEDMVLWSLTHQQTKSKQLSLFTRPWKLMLMYAKGSEPFSQPGKILQFP